MIYLFLMIPLVVGAPLADADDEIVLEDDVPAQVDGGDADEILLEEEDAAPVVLAPLPKPSFKARTLIKSSSDTALSVDTSHDAQGAGMPEDYVEAWSLFRLHLTHRSAPGRSWRVGGRLRLWDGMDHPNEGGAHKAILLTELTEFRYDRRFGERLVWQIGLQKVDWSVTDGMGPSVMFAPRDLRFGISGDPDDMLLPVEAALARYTLSFRHDAYLEMAFVPRHRPAELRLWGSDWAMMGSEDSGALPIGDIAWLIDPSVEDHWQNNLLYFARPELKPEDFSGALRVRGRLSGFELGVWGFYGYDLFPELVMDPDVAMVMGLLTQAGQGPLLERFTPELLEAMERFDGKMASARASGDSSALITSVFHRLFQLGAQARRSYGPMVFALETAWTPRFGGGRVLFSPSMQSVSGLATLHTALQIEYQKAPDLIAVLGLSDLWVPDVAQQPLMLLDSGYVDSNGVLNRPFDSKSAHLVTLNLAIKARVTARYEAMLAVVSHPFQADWLAMPSLVWRMDGERQQLRLAAELFGGDADSMFGRFARNDRVVLGYKHQY